MSTTRNQTLLDLLTMWCAEHGIRAEREELFAAIMCGDVEIAQERCRNPQQRFSVHSTIVVAQNSPLLAKSQENSDPVAGEKIPGLPYVSRGGHKLASVFDLWKVPVAGRVWLDAGCSTGGFSHCLLLRGAAAIHAVDVGYNVLDWRLRNLDAIIVHERTNIMSLTTLEPMPAVAVADLSFRSIEGAARQILNLCAENELYALIKPQFERKYRKTDTPEPCGTIFNGIVAPQESGLILMDLARRLADEGVRIDRMTKAGLKGKSGNQEFIAQLGLAPIDAANALDLLRTWNETQVETQQGGTEV